MFMIYWIAFKFIGIGIIPYSIKCKIIDNISTREISINIFLWNGDKNVTYTQIFNYYK